MRRCATSSASIPMREHPTASTAKASTPATTMSRRFALPALGPSSSMPTVPSRMDRWGRSTADMSAMAMERDLSSDPSTLGSMCRSTFDRLQRHPFIFLTARLTSVCMWVFMTGMDTMMSCSKTSAQTLISCMATPFLMGVFTGLRASISTRRQSRSRATAAIPVASKAFFALTPVIGLSPTATSAPASRKYTFAARCIETDL